METVADRVVLQFSRRQVAGHRQTAATCKRRVAFQRTLTLSTSRVARHSADPRAARQLAGVVLLGAFVNWVLLVCERRSQLAHAGLGIWLVIETLSGFSRLALGLTLVLNGSRRLIAMALAVNLGAEFYVWIAHVIAYWPILIDLADYRLIFVLGKVSLFVYLSDYRTPVYVVGLSLLLQLLRGGTDRATNWDWHSEIARWRRIAALVLLALAFDQICVDGCSPTSLAALLTRSDTPVASRVLIALPTAGAIVCFCTAVTLITGAQRVPRLAVLSCAAWWTVFAVFRISIAIIENDHWEGMLAQLQPTLIVVALAIHAQRVRKLLLDERTCPDCGYNNAHSESRVCVECGTQLMPLGAA